MPVFLRSHQTSVYGKFNLEQNLHWHFTVKKNNIKKHMPITSYRLISIIIAKNSKQNMFKIILRIEFIDTETTTMYKKNCAVKDIDIYLMAS